MEFSLKVEAFFSFADVSVYYSDLGITLNVSVQSFMVLFFPLNLPDEDNILKMYV